MNEVFKSIPLKDHDGKFKDVVERIHFDEKNGLTIATDGTIMVGIEEANPELKSDQIGRLMKVFPDVGKKADISVSPALLINALQAMADEDGFLPEVVGLNVPKDSTKAPLVIRALYSYGFALVMGKGQDGNTDMFEYVPRRAVKEKPIEK